MIGQTAEIAPADKKLYALRDVTGTVESIPLISASIMSKKIAEGIDALVLDVKTGSGAFMKTEADVAAAGRIAGRRSATRPASGPRRIITAMDAPLGRTVGNALEIVECIEGCSGLGAADLMESHNGPGRADVDAWQSRVEWRTREAIGTACHCFGIGARNVSDDYRNPGRRPRVVDDVRGYLMSPACMS